MKTILSNRIFITLFFLLNLSISAFSQNASISILKNGVKINPEDMSVKQGDKIVIQILNTNSEIKYKISNLNLEVRTRQYQQIKSQKQAEKYHKNITLTTDFENSPKIEVNVSSYASKNVTRLLLKFLSVEQLKENVSTRVDWITYGKEYEFWYYD